MKAKLTKEQQVELKETAKHLVSYLDGVDSICDDIRAGLLHVILLMIEDPEAEEEAKGIVWGLAVEYGKSASFLFSLIVEAITFCENERMNEPKPKVIH